ncbi:MAG: hypothetical protein IK990_03195 [Ruminiclostridium sp.]|nr:hypothetical protein [Ruminiclostridium sp.]
MNTNDFYKELFEKYALDEEKIRRNAIKAAKTPAWQRAVSAHWKTAAGAAAAVAVTVGAVAYTVGGSSGNIVIDSSETLLTASQRLHEAEQNYYNAATEGEQGENKTNIYVSFLDDLCYSDMYVSLSALPDSDDIEIECLYLNDSTVIRGKDAVDAYAETSADVRNIAGAKLCAPEKCYRDIQDLSKVYLAELSSENINDETFSPIDFNDEDPLTDANDFISTTASAEETTTPFSFTNEISSSELTSVLSDTAAGTTSGSPAIDITSDTTEPPAEISLTDDTEADDPELIETDDDQNEVSVSDDDDDDDNGVTEIEESETAASEAAPAVSEEAYETTVTEAETTVEASEITDAPTVGLMTQVYHLNVANSLETLLTGDHAVVLTRGEVYVYKLGGIIETQPAVYEISNPKIAYSDDSIVILTGCGASGRRNTVMTIDAVSGSVTVKDAGESLGEAEIGTIHYSRSDNRFFLKAVSSSTTLMYEITTTGEIQFKPLFEFSGAVSPAGSQNGKLWFTAADDSMKYTLYSFDCNNGQFVAEASFGTTCKIRRSKSFESFIISASDAENDAAATYVFDTALGSLVPVDISGDAEIAVVNGTIYVGVNDRNYIVSSGGTLTETGNRVSYTRKSNSRYVVASTDSEKVVVAEGSNWG